MTLSHNQVIALTNIIACALIVTLVCEVVVFGILSYQNESHLLFTAKLVDVKVGSQTVLVFDNGRLIAWSDLSLVQINKTYNVYAIIVGIFWLPFLEIHGYRIEEV